MHGRAYLCIHTEMQVVGLALIQLLGNQVERYEKNLCQEAAKVIQAAMVKFGDCVAIQCEVLEVSNRLEMNVGN